MRNRRRLITTGMLVVLALALGACSSGEKKADEGEAGGGGTETCSGSPVPAGQLQLPEGFPTPDGVTFTESEMEGPSGVADGYFEGDVKDAHDEWKAAFTDANYTVVSDELEEHDSEVNYESADGSSTGQVALREECKESGRTAVHITDRPA